MSPLLAQADIGLTSFQTPSRLWMLAGTLLLDSRRGRDEKAQFHRPFGWRGGNVVACGQRAAGAAHRRVVGLCRERPGRAIRARAVPGAKLKSTFLWAAASSATPNGAIIPLRCAT